MSRRRATHAPGAIDRCQWQSARHNRDPLTGPQLRHGAGASRAANVRHLLRCTAHRSWWNGVVALIWLRVQVARIQREETLLRSDEHYQDYVRQVRWRLLPGLW
jgi:hypothetical protein